MFPDAKTSNNKRDGFLLHARPCGLTEFVTIVLLKYLPHRAMKTARFNIKAARFKSVLRILCIVALVFIEVTAIVEILLHLPN